MKTSFLFPHRYKTAGWILLITGIVLGLLYLIVTETPNFLNVRVFAIVDPDIFHSPVVFGWIKNNIFDEIIVLLLIVGAVLVSFSKEKNEDEFISKIRLESLVWATYVNYAILALAVIFVYGLAFLWVMVFNMFTFLFFFLIRFHLVLYKAKKMIHDEDNLA